MINRKRESGFFNPFVLIITAMALSLVLAIRTTAALTQVTVAQDKWTEETYGSYGYFPPHVLDQSRDFELMPDMFQ